MMPVSACPSFWASKARSQITTIQCVTRWVAAPTEGEVDHNDNLESLIEKSGGDTTNGYRVMKDGKQVGTLEMVELVRSLVP